MTLKELTDRLEAIAEAMSHDDRPEALQRAILDLAQIMLELAKLADATAADLNGLHATLRIGSEPRA